MQKNTRDTKKHRGGEQPLKFHLHVADDFGASVSPSSLCPDDVLAKICVLITYTVATKQYLVYSAVFLWIEFSRD